MKYYYVYEMKALSFYQIFLLFIFYSFVGWICEVAYCSISQRRFVNRGFLYGPICPIYGCGAIIIFSFLMPLSDNLILLFFASMILTTILEYFTSWVMEKLFATKWWDYSNYKFNIHGRVCLLNSVLFGIMGIVAVHFVHPFVLSWLYKIDGFWTKFLALSLLGIFLVDLFFTLRSLVNFKLYLKRFEAFIQGLIMRVEKEKRTLQTAAIEENGRILVPLRDIVEAAGEICVWVEPGYIVIGGNETQLTTSADILPQLDFMYQ